MASISPSSHTIFPNGIYKPIPVNEDNLSTKTKLPTNNLQMASISPSSYPSSLQMASVSPFPPSHCWYSTMWVQIFGHSSVQSSSTFRSQKADMPIYILRFKKIEQGKLLYPKIFPPIFLYICQERSLNFSRKSKNWPDRFSPKTVYLKLGFHFASRCLSPKDPKCSPFS